MTDSVEVALSPPIIAALVAAIASLAVAVLAAITARSNGHRLHALQLELEKQKLQLENDLTEQRAAHDARRSYEYEARKRLYEQCEPLLFQAGELAEYARQRIIALARSAHRGDIRPDGMGWLAAPDDYFFESTVYALIAPLTTVKILQQRLTLLDMGLEPRLQVQYELLKSISQSLADDFQLANREPALPYDPDRTDVGEPDRDRLLHDSPEHYRRQGLYLGMLDVTVESLVHADGSRRKSFGEFLAEWRDPASSMRTSCGELVVMLLGFHPRTHPVLWRSLVAQCLQYDLLHRHGSVMFVI